MGLQLALTQCSARSHVSDGSAVKDSVTLVGGAMLVPMLGGNQMQSPLLLTGCPETRPAPESRAHSTSPTAVGVRVHPPACPELPRLETSPLSLTRRAAQRDMGDSCALGRGKHGRRGVIGLRW